MIGAANSFFWYAPWLLFLLRYVDLTQVALLQAISLFTLTVMEIPSGALTDLVGKRKALLLSFALTGAGNMAMAFSSQFWQFAWVYVVINVGLSFYSGTMQAFMYDTLLSHKSEGEYPKVLARSEAAMNTAIAIACVSGGLLYQVWIGLPFLLSGMFMWVGLVFAWLADEPEVDSEVFSWVNFYRQTKRGFGHLFDSGMLRHTILLLTFGVFSAAAYELLDDVAVVDWGYDAVGIGILYTSVVILAIPSGFLYESMAKRFRPAVLVVGAIGVLVANYLLSPWITWWVWTGLFLVRVVYSPIKNAALADLINRNTRSSIRATTFSTYEWLRKLPFVFLAGWIGMSMQEWGVRLFSFGFAVLLLVLLLVQVGYWGVRRVVKTN